MKTNKNGRRLLFGDFITAAYDACGKHEAPGIVRMAVNARWVEFLGGLRLVISPTQSRLKIRAFKALP